MRLLGTKFLELDDGKQLSYFCPGCEGLHTVTVEPPPRGWKFNGDLILPTFVPSIKTTSGHYVDGWTGPDCWCTYNKKHPDKPAPFHCFLCHCFIENGVIRFLSDCTHKLANQAGILLPDLPEQYRR